MTDSEASAAPITLPMTVAAPLKWGYAIVTTIGVGATAKYYYPKNRVQGSYWFLAINRYTLNADYNSVQTDNDKVPAGISPYDTTDYMLVVATDAVSTIRLPQGPLYSFLVDNGAGRQLDRLEQISKSLSCGELTNMAYTLIGILGPGRSSVVGIEASLFHQSLYEGAILTSTLIGTLINGKVIYSPTMQ